MKKIDLKCPNCGAIMKVSKDKTEVSCQYCKYKFLLDNEPSVEELSQKEERLSYARETGIRKAREDSIIRQKKKKLVTMVMITMSILAVGILGMLINYYSREYLEDPFECLSIAFVGIDGDGAVKTIDNNKCSNYSDIEYIYTKQNKLSEGEKIKIIAQSERYRFGIKSKEYTVTGLSLYLVNLEDLTEELLKKVHEYSYNHLENARSISFKGEIVSRTPYKLYLYTNESDQNILYDVYKIKVKTSTGIIYEKFQVVYYKDFILLNNDELFSYSSMYHCGNSILAGDPDSYTTNYAGFLTGFQSIKDFEAYIRKDNDGTFIIKEK